MKKDEKVIDYEMESEDEWAEQHGEDIEKKDVEEEAEDEEMANEEEEDGGFIVSDGHLSVCEYEFSEAEGDEEKEKEIALRREKIKQQRQQMLAPTADTSAGQSYCVTEISSIS